MSLPPIRRRAEKAPPGPWWTGLWAGVFSGERGHDEMTIPGKHMGICRVGFENSNKNEGTVTMPLDKVRDTADFIAHARQDVPYLLGLVEELRGALEHSRKCVSDSDDCPECWKAEKALEAASAEE